MKKRRDLFLTELSFVWQLTSIDQLDILLEGSSPLKQVEKCEDDVLESSDQDTVSMNLLLGWDTLVPSLPSQAESSDLLYFVNIDETDIGSLHGSVRDTNHSSLLDSNFICQLERHGQHREHRKSHHGLTLQEAIDANNLLINQSFDLMSTTSTMDTSPRRKESLLGTAYQQQLQTIWEEIRNHEGRSGH